MPLINKILAALDKHKRLEITLMMGLSCALSVALAAGRMYFTHTVLFGFLLWNLFLALIPFAISSYLILNNSKIKSNLVFIVLASQWLLFFPNSPYILTDLFHLKQRSLVPYWYDLALILSFAWNGLMLGFISLMDMQSVVTKRSSKSWGWVFSIVSLVLGSFGIYLGRYLRFNSWDLLSHPLPLLRSIAGRVFHPGHHSQTMGVTITFSAFLIAGYVLLRQVSKMKAEV